MYVDGTPFFHLGDTAWELFHRLDREQADRYLANRAAKGFTVIQAVVPAELDGLNEPIIWILGGDHNPDNDAERAVIEAMARGLKQGDAGNHLITYHPRGPGLSSDYFHNADWLDFNMFQSASFPLPGQPRR